jgi:penicillin-binding protein 2
MFLNNKSKLNIKDINPDEVFLDSKNVSGFEQEQFEGRIEKPITKKTFSYVGVFFIFVIAVFFGKTFSLQISNGEAYFKRSENNRLRSILIPPNRGIVYDRNNEKLAWNGEDSRLYMQKPGIGHILGFVGLPSKDDLENNKDILLNSTIGKDGVEEKYEDILMGKYGLRLLEADSQNNIISENIQEQPEAGGDLVLSIDTKVQSEFYKIIKLVAQERGFGGGAGVLLNTENGEILSLVSYPEYDSEILSSGGPKEKIDEFINDGRKPFLNRAISGLYTPGSIVKPIVALAALNEKIISPEKQIFSSGSISIPNPFDPTKKNIFYDWEAHGLVDMKRALAVSSNVYFYTIGGGFEDMKGLGVKKLENYYRSIGLGSKTGIDLTGEAEGLVPNSEWKAKMTDDSVWRIGDTYNASIGQGFFQVTPVQMAVFSAFFANNGYIVRPHLAEEQSVPAVGSEIPQKYFDVIKDGMRMAVTSGTAGALNIPSVKIAAKTGTAQIGALKQYINSWIIGFLPYENPKFAFSIVMEKGPADNNVGALYAARRLFEWMSINTPEYLKN